MFCSTHSFMHFRYIVYSCCLLLGHIAAVAVEAQAAPVESSAIIEQQSEWQYRLAPKDSPAKYSAYAYDASDWESGWAGFGYGDDDDKTEVDMRGRTTRLAIRHRFELSDGEDPAQLWLAIRYDDAFELWINGKRLFAKGVSHKDGKRKVDSHEAKDWEYFSLAEYADVFTEYRNCIAILGYNVGAGSSDFTLDPKLILGTPAPGSQSRMNKFRVVWSADPTTEATIVWNQAKGKPGTVHYGTVDHLQEVAAYESSLAPQRVVDQSPMTTCMAHLTGLQADTEYFFCLKDESETSQRFKFRTAPSDPAASFTFIAGGDSRNGRKVRVDANRTVAKLRPLFVAFTGDMIVTDRIDKWEAWLDDWQQTISEDGHIVPLVPHRGNHEGNPLSMYQTFGTPRDAYYAFSIGGDLFRYYALNSEIPANGAQGEWLDADLKSHHDSVTHLVAGYHKPMRPHVEGKPEGSNPFRWADSFYRYGLDLALESDSHVMKRTLPLRPDKDGEEGFSHAADDSNATVYIGEGCWGAPLRAANDGKSWTLAKGSFNGFDWMHVTPESIEIKTVRVGDPAQVEQVQSGAIFQTPKGLQLWEPEGGTVLVVPADK